MTIRIDAHQHFWNPARGDYDWMPRDNAVLNRVYLPEDLAPRLAEAGIAKTVLVQAAASVEETEYMLGIADATDTVAAVVGWIDFEDRSHLRHLERLRDHPKFVGVRPMIQDIPDVDWMLRDDVQWAYSALADLDLTFDALGFSRHLGNFLTLLKRYPKLRVVVDHCMKPQVRDHGTAREELAFWANGMARIARETGAYCKLSGLVTEANDGWNVEDLRPYAARLLASFGPDRMMWGSDWPVCLLSASYADWRQAAEALTAGLGEADRDEIFGGTAARFYGIKN
ncbi:L-fuconolactonase [Mesorhizobium albiziae]|uniref:L-fuconolactonase n=1 Tax=Neomesorhizobium albiziae TaxID=335020 RepID=A0A1I4AZA8_9HYPH|nr:amidohydrolase family protein [Mesorhizobium albiziae]GLS34167.1 amidohydrolase [Mesorhizobium albiziae]SFK61019.1 L-fuconolactonase [Mesorhizobium albiziae]